MGVNIYLRVCYKLYVYLLINMGEGVFINVHALFVSMREFITHVHEFAWVRIYIYNYICHYLGVLIMYA